MSAPAQRRRSTQVPVEATVPTSLLRAEAAAAAGSVRTAGSHFTRLSQLNFSIDTHFYPLGSCTMKYNPKACNQYAMLPELLGRHPLAPSRPARVLQILFELQEMLKEVTGMRGVSLTPMAGAQGEFAGVAMIRAYHRARKDLARTEIIVPDAAHGTEPGDRDDVRLHGARDPDAAERRHRPRGVARESSVRRRPASC